MKIDITRKQPATLLQWLVAWTTSSPNSTVPLPSLPTLSKYRTNNCNYYNTITVIIIIPKIIAITLLSLYYLVLSYYYWIGVTSKRSSARTPSSWSWSGTGHWSRSTQPRVPKCRGLAASWRPLIIISPFTSFFVLLIASTPLTIVTLASLTTNLRWRLVCLLFFIHFYCFLLCWYWFCFVWIDIATLKASVNSVLSELSLPITSVKDEPIHEMHAFFFSLFPFFSFFFLFHPSFFHSFLAFLGFFSCSDINVTGVVLEHQRCTTLQPSLEEWLHKRQSNWSPTNTPPSRTHSYITEWIALPPPSFCKTSIFIKVL